MKLSLDNNLNFKQTNKELLEKLGGYLNNMKHYSVDRKEGNYTILQDTHTKKVFQIETSKLPPFLNDGDVIKKSIFGEYEFDLNYTNKLKEEINGKQRKLFK